MSLRPVIEALADYDSPLLANTLDYIDPTPTHEIYMSGDIGSLTPTLGPTVGVAATCKLDSSTPGGSPDLDLYWEQLERISKIDEPVVWVVEAVGQRPEHECVMGDGMAKTFYSIGCVGAVSNGRVRDVAGLLSTPFAAYARGTCVHHCALRYVEIDTPVNVGGITVQSGDIIHASPEGVIKIPPQSAESLVERGAQMRAFEHDAHAICRRTDVSLADKRRITIEFRDKYGFGK
jgi:regulator of RNase E activity RraA